MVTLRPGETTQAGRFTATALDPAGLVALDRKPIGDARGYLERMFCAQDLAPWLGGKAVAQVNRTLTARRGVVRGLHFQRPPHAEIKLVTCLRGAVFDVAVDLRRGSPTFLRWRGELLSGDNRRILVIPEGFAHGFQTLAEDCEMLYLHTAAFEAGAEGALNARDPRLAIDWPEPITQMSARDEAHPMLDDAFAGIAP